MVAVHRRGHLHSGKTGGHELEQCHLRGRVLQRHAVRAVVGVVDAAPDADRCRVVGVGEQHLLREGQRTPDAPPSLAQRLGEPCVDRLDELDGRGRPDALRHDALLVRSSITVCSKAMRSSPRGTRSADRAAPISRDTSSMDRPHVVVIGAGFGGLTAVRTLGGVPADVTLIDQHNFHTFSPLLYQVATAAVAPDDIAPSVRGVVRREPNAEFRMARVVGIDFDARRVLLADGDPVPYDYLILAAGAVSSDFGVPGVREHALPLKSLDDAIHVRTTVLTQFEAADRDHAPVERGALRVVVAGGGPTGVELSGALAELFTKVLAKDFDRLDVDRAEVVLVEATGALLGTFSPRSQTEAMRELEARGVQI